jgi:excisionase family DNA binding protein
MSEAHLLTSAQAAALLGVNDSRVRQLVRSGGLRAERFGRSWLIHRAEVERYRDERSSQERGSGRAAGACDPITDYCRTHGLEQYLPRVLDLIQERFPGAGEIRIEPRRDHESDESWLTLHFQVAESPDAALARYDELLDALAKRVPWPARDHFHLDMLLA